MFYSLKNTHLPLPSLPLTLNRTRVLRLSKQVAEKKGPSFRLGFLFSVSFFFVSSAFSPLPLAWGFSHSARLCQGEDIPQVNTPKEMCGVGALNIVKEQGPFT